MNVIKIGKRGFVYILCVAALIVFVGLRRTEVMKERTATPVSFIEEVEKYGKPVKVLLIKPTVFEMKEKFTVVPCGERKFEGYVTRKVSSRLEEGQMVSSLNGDSGQTGRVSYLSPEVDMMSGLYKFAVKFEEPFACDNGKLFIAIKTSEKKNIIEVPNEALYIELGKFYVWKVENGKAHRQEIILTARSGYSSIVSEGLNENDILVVAGQSCLKEGDMVRIIDEKGGNYQEK